MKIDGIALFWALISVMTVGLLLARTVLLNRPGFILGVLALVILGCGHFAAREAFKA